MTNSSRIKNVNFGLQLITLLILLSFFSVGAMIFAPALPKIIEEFSLPPTHIFLFISTYLFGVTISQLMYGLIAYIIGRKFTVYLGIFLAMIGILIGLLALKFDSYQFLLLSRFITGLGAGVGTIMAFILIRDMYEYNETRKMISYTLATAALMPGIFGSIGGFIIETFSLMAVFIFLLFYCLLAWLLCRKTSKTFSTFTDRKFCIIEVFNKFKTQFTNQRLILGSILMGGNTALIYIFSTLTPFIVIKQMNISASHYGRYMLIPSAGLAIGALLSAWMAKLLDTHIMIRFGLTMIVLNSALVAFAVHFSSPIFIFICGFFLYLGIGFCYSNASALTLNFTKENAYGSATVSFVNMCITMFAIAFLQLLSQIQVLFISPILLGIGMLMTSIYLYLNIIPSGTQKSAFIHK